VSDLYTASEARRKLGGIAPASLQRLVQAGKIRKVVPPANKKRGLYIKEDVDKLIAANREFTERHALPLKDDTYELIQAKSENDIKNTVQIARRYFGETVYDLEQRLNWFHTVPNGDYVLKHNGMIVGYFSMQGINPGTIDRIFKPRSAESIQREDIIPLLSGEPLDCIISGVGVKNGESRRQTIIYGLHLLRGIFRTFIELGEQGVNIRKILTGSSTVAGIKLSRRLGFNEYGYINNEQIGFILDLETSEFLAVKRYREVLKAFVCQS
jgi:hypothetical protein